MTQFYEKYVKSKGVVGASAIILLPLLALLANSSYVIWRAIFFSYIFYIIYLIHKKKTCHDEELSIVYSATIVAFIFFGLFLLATITDGEPKCNYLAVLNESDMLRVNEARAISRNYYAFSMLAVLSVLFLGKKLLKRKANVKLSLAILPALLATSYFLNGLFPLYENTYAGELVYDVGVYNYKTETTKLAYCDDERYLETNDLYENVDATNSVDILFIFILIITVTDLLLTRGNSWMYRSALIFTPCVILRKYIVMLMEFKCTLSPETISGIVLRLAYAVIVIVFIINVKSLADNSSPQ